VADEIEFRNSRIHWACEILDSCLLEEVHDFSHVRLLVHEVLHAVVHQIALEWLGHSRPEDASKERLLELLVILEVFLHAVEEHKLVLVRLGEIKHDELVGGDALPDPGLGLSHSHLPVEGDVTLNAECLSDQVEDSSHAFATVVDEHHFTVAVGLEDDVLYIDVPDELLAIVHRALLFIHQLRDLVADV